MTDIVERLRVTARMMTTEKRIVVAEEIDGAADEIERLRGEVKDHEEASWESCKIVGEAMDEDAAKLAKLEAVVEAAKRVVNLDDDLAFPARDNAISDLRDALRELEAEDE